MLEPRYLVALSLIEQNSIRLMPIGGKSIKEITYPINSSGNNTERILLELLTRIINLSERGEIKKVNEGKSILLINIPMKLMQETLPILKAKSIESGDSKTFLRDLSKISAEIWSVSYTRYEGMTYEQIHKA